MKDQVTDSAGDKFVPIQISSELLQKAIDKSEALEALEKQKKALHDDFWDEVCSTYGLDREQTWELDKTYIESGVVMLKPKESCCGICKGEQEIPDVLKKLVGRALFGRDTKSDSVKEVPAAEAAE